jgi:hypothetical protein
MRKRRLISALIFAVPVVLAAATFAVAGDGGKSHFKADTLTGYQEVVGPGPISTTGTGTFEATLNSDGDAINYTLTYAALEGGAVTQAHIHFGQRSVGGSVIAFLCGGGGKPACPASPATVSGTIVAADIGTTGSALQGIEAGSFDEAVRAIRAGAVYANVHTTRWPAGEIRGQVNDNNQKDEN